MDGFVSFFSYFVHSFTYSHRHSNNLNPCLFNVIKRPIQSHGFCFLLEYMTATYGSHTRCVVRLIFTRRDRLCQRYEKFYDPLLNRERISWVSLSLACSDVTLRLFTFFCGVLYDFSVYCMFAGSKWALCEAWKLLSKEKLSIFFVVSFVSFFAVRLSLRCSHMVDLAYVLNGLQMIVNQFESKRDKLKKRENFSVIIMLNIWLYCYMYCFDHTA